MTLALYGKSKARRMTLLAAALFGVMFAVLAGSVFYLDSYRARLIDERVARLDREAQIVATALSRIPTTDVGPCGRDGPEGGPGCTGVVAVPIDGRGEFLDA